MLRSLQCVEWERNKTLLDLRSMVWAQGNPPTSVDAELPAAGQPCSGTVALNTTITPLPPSRQGQHFHADVPKIFHNILTDTQLPRHS